MELTIDQYTPDPAVEFKVYPGGARLADLMKELAEQFGYFVPSEDRILLLDESAFASDEDSDGGSCGAKVLTILGRLYQLTDVSNFVLQKDTSHTVYKMYQAALNELERYDESDSSQIRKNETIEIFDSIVAKGVSMNASDIHIKMTDDPQAKIFYRVDGDVSLTPDVKSLQDMQAMIGSIFEWWGADNAAEKPFKPDSNNSTSLERPCVIDKQTRRIELRCQYRVQNQSERAFIVRIIVGTSKFKKLEDIGIDKAMADVFRKMVRQPSGMILISGPTGAGKSTTLNAVIDEKPAKKVVHTLENPIEAKHSDPLIFQGIMSKNVKGDISDMMRFDPDIIVIGEMRLGDEVEAAMGLSRTGHLILSSIHANDSLSIIERLLQMGVKREEMSERNLIRMLVAQRLVPVLCPHCKVEGKEQSVNEVAATASPSAKEKLQNFAMRIFFESPSGCKKCFNTGRAGRVLVCEYIVVDDSGRESIRSGDSIGWVKTLTNNGWKSMADRTWDLIGQGLVDPVVADGVVPGVLIGSDDWRYQ